MSDRGMKTVFFRILEGSDKAALLLAAVREPETASGRLRFDAKVTSFAFVPGSPFAYWMSEALLKTFVSSEPLNHQGRLVVSTNPLNDDFRYVREWWEPDTGGLGDTWKPWAKGGAYSPFYYDIDTVISWAADRSSFAGFLGTENRPLERPASVQHFFRPALTWPRRTQGGLSFRAMPAGSIFADKGPAVFVDADDTAALLALLAIVNARAFRALVDVQMAFGSYEVGVIQRTPIPHVAPPDHTILSRLARCIWKLRRNLDTQTETSHAFIRPALLVAEGNTIAARAKAFAERIAVTESEIFGIQDEIDVRCFELYGIDESDRRAITQGSSANADELAEDGAGQDPVEDAGADTDEEGDTDGTPDPVGLAAELVSWAVGVAFGRFDVRLATGARPLPPEPEPFDPLPLCSPAMLTGSDGLPLRSPPVGYPVAFPENGILVDDRGHARDLTAVVRGVFDEVFNASAEAWWFEVGALLDPKDHDLRAWIASSFFEHHLKRHSKSRRKAPILWQLAIPSGRYSIWLYAHRLTRDTFFQIQNEVVTPKLAHEERQLTGLTQSMGAHPSAKDRKEIAAQEIFVQELRALLDEVKRVAPLWNPLLDDGVVLTMAPLWRLVPQHKAWQKELKSEWEELSAGKYDWAHLAMHLWPERVVPKCAADRSLAIAHGLEDHFWVEALSGRWQQRASIAETVRYLEENLYSDRMRQTVEELVEFSRAYATTGGHGPGWWTALSTGDHDDLALALALWPERVLRQAVAAPIQFTALGINLPRARTEEELLAKLLSTHPPRLSAHELQMLEEFCSYRGDREIWRRRWAEFSAGGHDEFGIARAVHTPRVVAKAQADPNIARVHDLFRWFWLFEDSGPRRLKEPPEEIAGAVRVRTSVAVKAALKSMLEAPGVTPGRSRGRARQATSTAADGETF